ncbi:uncharacterized protein VTP21DRAFT_5849 [Calcarisporiella thermophila]|uniref:uncharacterized protein n=1 Tax=Calcarisporiella thermophila TaxID=911321 RepID=UPI00374462E3
MGQSFAKISSNKTQVDPNWQLNDSNHNYHYRDRSTAGSGHKKRNKSKNKNRISKDMIGLPQNFQHNGHIGIDDMTSVKDFNKLFIQLDEVALALQVDPTAEPQTCGKSTQPGPRPATRAPKEALPRKPPIHTLPSQPLPAYHPAAPKCKPTSIQTSFRPAQSPIIQKKRWAFAQNYLRRSVDYAPMSPLSSHFQAFAYQNMPYGQQPSLVRNPRTELVY